MAEFSHVQAIQTVCDDNNSRHIHQRSDFLASGKASVRLKVAGSNELLSINCPNLNVAESMADLVDGYCRLVNNSSTSIWNRKGAAIFCLHLRLLRRNLSVVVAARDSCQDCHKFLRKRVCFRRKVLWKICNCSSSQVVLSWPSCQECFNSSRSKKSVFSIISSRVAAPGYCLPTFFSISFIMKNC